MAFAYFVILAGMRTGSNLLEESLSTVPDLTLHGELFNPYFFGRPKNESAFGKTLNERDADPLAVLRALQAKSDGLQGFRLFRDHDPRVLSHVLADQSCAKVVLTRRLVDSFVSLEIARATGQWWLGDARSAKSATVSFDADAFADFAAQDAEFHSHIDETLQKTGQAAFRLSYDDLFNADVISGLASFLGASGIPNTDEIQARVQNPTPVEERLTNPAVARSYLASRAEDIGDTTNYEPARGPGVRFFQACENVPLLYLPIRGAGHDAVADWLHGLDDGNVLIGMTQKELRRWKRKHPGHLSFSVLRHPLARVHATFCQHILPTDQERYADIRSALLTRYEVALPAKWPSEGWSLEKHRVAFKGFLDFLQPNLNGQTSLRVDSTWASQERLLKAIASLVVPDRVIREDRLAEELEEIAARFGVAAPAGPVTTAPTEIFNLFDVVTSDIEKAAEAAYRRDYMMFGFSPFGSYAA